MPKTATTMNRPTVRRAVRALATAVAGTGTLVALTTETAAAGIQNNHNESAGHDRRRTRRTAVISAVAGVATTAATVALPALDVTVARIAVNHNEAAGRDRRS